MAATYYDYKGDCPIAERLCQQVLIVPTYHTLKQAEIENIAQSLNRAWTAISSKKLRTESAVHDFSDREIAAGADCSVALPQETGSGK